MSRRNGSVSRAVETATKNRLHMDRNPQHSRITDPSNPAGRRKEIDNVMKRARQASPGSWDRKLLEVEEKDPNRWRHTGYKQMYLEGSGSASPRRSRSPGRRSRSPVGARRSRSPAGRRSRSPIGRRTRSPIGRRTRSPIGRRTRSPIGRRTRSPIGRRTRSPVGRRSRSPRNSRSKSQRRTPRRSPRRSPIRRGSPGPRRSPQARSGARRESPRVRPRPRPPAQPSHQPPRNRPPSPPDPRKSSPSGSSVSSCSDESCSVCSAKNKKQPPQPQPPKGPVKPRQGSTSPNRAVRPAAARAVQPTKELLKARESSKRSREEKVLEWQRSQLAVRASAPIPPTHIKREGERRPPPPAPPAGAPAPPQSRRRERPVSPAVVAAALNDTDSDSESDASSDPQPQRLTLSERFGKMAQWSADRSARLENMRITRRETSLHVVRIERDPRQAADDEPAVADDIRGIDPAPVGSYPEELLAVAPGGLPSWDDVRVRYDYYKKRGYLRGLTLGDYVKWEEWWYKYQEWLKHERAYERWAEEGGTGRRDRRRRGGRHKKS